MEISSLLLAVEALLNELLAGVSCSIFGLPEGFVGSFDLPFGVFQFFASQWIGRVGRWQIWCGRGRGMIVEV